MYHGGSQGRYGVIAPIQKIIMAFASRDYGQTLNISVRIFGALVEIQTRHYTNVNQKSYRLSQILISDICYILWKSRDSPSCPLRLRRHRHNSWSRSMELVGRHDLIWHVRVTTPYEHKADQGSLWYAFRRILLDVFNIILEHKWHTSTINETAVCCLWCKSCVRQLELHTAFSNRRRCSKPV
jgi:hypothetical protein